MHNISLAWRKWFGGDNEREFVAQLNLFFGFTWETHQHNFDRCSNICPAAPRLESVFVATVLTLLCIPRVRFYMSYWFHDFASARPLPNQQRSSVFSRRRRGS